MRFINFLNEKTHSPQDIANILSNTCSEYLHDIKNFNVRLYRGLSGEVKSFIMHKQRKRRTPADNNIEFQKLVDNAFQTIFGEKVRSQSFFCTGHLNDAHSYGNLYVAFPSNSYTSYWSPKIKDFYTIHNWLYGIKDDPNLLAFCLLHILFNYSKLINKYNFVHKTFQTKDYFIQLDIPYDIKNDFDKLENPDVRKQIIKQILKKYPDCITIFIKHIYTKDNIITALKSDNEIMIKCDTLYLIKDTIYDDVHKILKTDGIL